MKIENANSTTTVRITVSVHEKLTALAGAAQVPLGEYLSIIVDKEFTRAEPFIVQSQRLAKELTDLERRIA